MFLMVTTLNIFLINGPYPVKVTLEENTLPVFRSRKVPWLSSRHCPPHGGVLDQVKGGLPRSGDLISPLQKVARKTCS